MSHRRRLHISLLALLTTAGLAAVAGAQSDEPKGTAKPTPAAAAAGEAPKLGQAHIVPAPEQMAKPPLSAEEKALLAIEEEGRQQVLELVKSIEGMPDGPARLAMEKKVVQLKQDNYIRLLRAKADFARARGDLKTAQQAEMVIEGILHPRPAPTATVSRPLPDQAVAK